MYGSFSKEMTRMLGLGGPAVLDVAGMIGLAVRSGA